MRKRVLAFLEKRMKKQNPIQILTLGEKLLWLASVVVVAGSFLLFQSDDILTLIASLIGVSALIYVAKGHVLGQVLIILFAVFYGAISFYFQYYGEMITYLGMSAPIAVFSLISWIRHPFKDSQEVEVSKLSRRQKIFAAVSSFLVTVLFYFILKALGNARLLISTFSVTTSFFASYLTFCRSPYYALAYAANDVVLIVLWVLAAMTDLGSIPMVACFVMFLVNDIHGFICWKKRYIRQTQA